MEAVLYAEVYLICLIIVMLLLLWNVRRSTFSASERWLRLVLIMFMINFASNFFFTIFNSVWIIEGIRMPLAYALKTAYHVSLCMGVVIWSGFNAVVLKNSVYEKRARNMLWILGFLFLALGITNFYHHGFFEITSEGAYHRNGLFHLEMGLLVLLSVVGSVRVLLARKKETDPMARAHYMRISSFSLSMILAWILSFVGESVPVICVCITIELLALFMGITMEQVSLDKLTQVNNRNNLMAFIRYKIGNHTQSIYFLMVDMDYFKKINDTYGHLEGDWALIQVANALKRACGAFQKRPYISRYGGDEFIVVIEGEHGDADELCTSIRTELEAANEALRLREETEGKLYRLLISIGVAAWEEGMNADAAIAAVDRKLYETKRARR